MFCIFLQDGLKHAKEYGKILKERFFTGNNAGFLSGNYYKEVIFV